MKSVKELESAGCDFLVLPCNTLHGLISDIRKNTSLPVLDLIEEASNCIKSEYRSIGILSTRKTRIERLYDKNLTNLKLVYPSEKEQSEISKIIIRIIRNKSRSGDRGFLEAVIKKMINGGAEKVVLACTDLANLLDNNPNTIDSTDILIKMTLKKMKEASMP